MMPRYQTANNGFSPAANIGQRLSVVTTAMESSLLIGRLFAVVYLCVGVGMVLRPLFYREMINDMANHPGVLYLGALLALAVGLLIVMYHNIWPDDWRLLITLFGWMALLKGILLTMLPDLLARQMRALGKRAGLLRGWGVVALLLGGFFAYWGFFA